MADNRGQVSVLIVDDEWHSPILKAVQRRLDQEGWQVENVEPNATVLTGDEFESAALYAINDRQPDGVILDVRFGTHKDDQFKGLSILRKILQVNPRMPVLMFTQYAQGPERETAVRGCLQWDARVDFIDKLASPEEVVLRLRHLIGRTPDKINIGSRVLVDTRARVAYVKDGGELQPIIDIQGMKFGILQELAMTHYRSPGEVVPFSRLERFSEGEDARASLRVRIREIKDSIGKASGEHFGARDLIINVRDQGYCLVPPVN